MMSKRGRLVIFLVNVILHQSRGLRIHPVFGDRMVLQMAPSQATIWGYHQDPSSITITLDCNGKRTEVNEKSKVLEENMWKYDLPPTVANTVCDVIVIAMDTMEESVLSDVTFGDVYLCSGQSNMQFAMKSVENGTEEVAASASYTDIRFSKIAQNPSEIPLTDEVSLVHPWTDSSDSAHLNTMSAVCFLYARNIQDMMGENKVPLGLIGSYWGGTRVEAWSSQQALDNCGVPEDCGANNPQNCNTYLWNGMIHPIKEMTLKGFLWYQGEANTHHNRDLYNCTFPTLIDNWRSEFSSSSNTDPEAPFGFVQLSTIAFGTPGPNYPVTRWHQTADFGFVPNSRMQNVFMAVAIDTTDKREGGGGIHPWYKQKVAERLALAGMNVAYGATQYPQMGPWPLQMTLHEDYVNIEFNMPFEYDKSTISGFYYCCEEDFADCDSTVDNFLEVAPEYVMSSGDAEIRVYYPPAEASCPVIFPPHLAYLWRQTPYETPFTAAIYATEDNFSLPAAPWKFSSEQITNWP